MKMITRFLEENPTTQSETLDDSHHRVNDDILHRAFHRFSSSKGASLHNAVNEKLGTILQIEIANQS